MTERRIVVVTAGLRAPSTTRMLGDELSRAVVDELERLGGTAVITSVELREHGHALVDAMFAGFAAGKLQEAVDSAVSADALIVVSPTMSAGISGLFKMFFDVLEPGSLSEKPVILAATGGTQRHSLVLDHGLRPLFSYLRAHPVATGVFAATADFGDGAAGGLERRVQQAARELAVQLAGRPVVTQPVAQDVTPFAQLLAR